MKCDILTFAGICAFACAAQGSVSTVSITNAAGNTDKVNIEPGGSAKFFLTVTGTNASQGVHIPVVWWVYDIDLVVNDLLDGGRYNHQTPSTEEATTVVVNPNDTWIATTTFTLTCQNGNVGGSDGTSGESEAEVEVLVEHGVWPFNQSIWSNRIVVNCVPTPGAMGLLAASGLLVSRRRRERP